MTKDTKTRQNGSCPVITGGSYGVGIVTVNVDVRFASTTPMLLVTEIVTS